MPIYAIKHIPYGGKLAEDVHTSLGGLLFQKGIHLFERELELLEAFLIKEVVVDDETGKAEKKEDRAEGKQETGKSSGKSAAGNKEFEEKFDKAVSSVKNLLQRVQGGENIPVMEMREMVTPLLQKVQEQPNFLLALSKVSNVDGYIYEHSIAVGMLSYVIARWLKVPEKEWMQISLAGTFLDIGKTKIDRKILL
ncbi:MAG: c-di-GMP phosphodiesterase, partial [Clostridia bacterium]